MAAVLAAARPVSSVSRTKRPRAPRTSEADQMATSAEQLWSGKTRGYFRTSKNNPSSQEYDVTARVFFLRGVAIAHQSHFERRDATGLCDENLVFVIHCEFPQRAGGKMWHSGGSSWERFYCDACPLLDKVAIRGFAVCEAGDCYRFKG